MHIHSHLNFIFYTYNLYRYKKFRFCYCVTWHAVTKAKFLQTLSIHPRKKCTTELCADDIERAVVPSKFIFIHLTRVCSSWYDHGNQPKRIYNVYIFLIEAQHPWHSKWWKSVDILNFFFQKIPFSIHLTKTISSDVYLVITPPLVAPPSIVRYTMFCV